MPHVAVITQLDLLPPLDGAAPAERDSIDLSLQVSATLARSASERGDDETAPVPQASGVLEGLLPWNWSGIGARFYWTDGTPDPDDPTLLLCERILHFESIDQDSPEAFPDWTPDERTMLRDKATVFVREHPHLVKVGANNVKEYPDTAIRWVVDSVTEAEHEETSEGETQLGLRHVVGASLANLPAPIPYVLDLAHCVRIPHRDFDAVPETEVGGVTARRFAVFGVVTDFTPPGGGKFTLPEKIKVRPVGVTLPSDPATIAQAPLVVEYDAPGGDALPRQAWINARLMQLPEPAPAAPVPGQVDLQTLWVHHGLAPGAPGAIAEDHSEDWYAYFRTRIGARFDLTQFLLDRLRGATDALKPTPEQAAADDAPLAAWLKSAPAAARWLAEAVLTVSRDLCGLGWSHSEQGEPRGSWLVDLVLARLRATQGESNVAAGTRKQLLDRLLAWDAQDLPEFAWFDLAGADPTTSPKLAEPPLAAWRWLAFLTTLPGDAGQGAREFKDELERLWQGTAWGAAKAWADADAATIQGELRKLLALLERFQSLIATPETIRAAVQAQWSAAVPMRDLQRTPLLQALDGVLANIEPRTAMEAGLLDRFIAAVLPQDLRGPEVRERLPETTGAAFKRYLKERFSPETTQPTGFLPVRRGPATPVGGGPFVDWMAARATKEIAKAVREKVLPAEPQDIRRHDMDAHALTWQVAPISRFHDPRQPAGDSARAPVSSDRDIERQISGYGVLMRRRGAGWSCLNLAQAFFAQDDQPVSAKGVVIVPQRFAYRDDLREAFVSYDENPLGAENPEHDDPARSIGAIRREGMKDHVTREEPARATDRFLRFRAFAPQPKPTPDERLKLPKLVFGREYDLATFGVTNAGLPPHALTGWKQGDLGHPTALRLQPPEELPFPPDIVLPKNVLHGTRYLRRVPVGPVRFGGGREAGPAADAPGQPALSLPEFSADVQPLAGELPPVDDAAMFQAPRPKGAPPDPERVPLLLLWPAQWGPRNGSEFRFDIRKPSIALKAWKRWRRAQPDQPGRNTDDDIRGTEAAIKVIRRRPDRVDDSADESLDDPAVDEFARVELHVRYRFGKGVQPVPAPAAEIRKGYARWRARPAGGGKLQERLAPWQSMPIPVTVTEKRDATDATLLANDDGIVVTVPRGTVWELRIYSRVRSEYFVSPGEGPKFLPSRRGQQPEKAPVVAYPGLDDPDKPGFTCFAPFRLAIEAATDAHLPKPEELWTWLRPAVEVRTDRLSFLQHAGGQEALYDLQAGAAAWTDVLSEPGFANDLAGLRGPGQARRARLAIDTGADTELRLDWIKTVRVQQQRWRWNGQPVPAFPFAQKGAGQQSAVPAIDTELGDMDLQIGEPLPPPLTCRLWEIPGFGDRSDEDHAISEGQFALPRRKFAAKEDKSQVVYSDELPDGRALLIRFSVECFSRYGTLHGSAGASVQARSTLHATRWRRLLVKSRIAELPAPAVKLIVPLTQGLRPVFPLKNEPPVPPGALVVLHGPWFDQAGLAERLGAEVTTTAYYPEPDGAVLYPVAGRDPILDPGPKQTAPITVATEVTGPFGYSFDPRGVESPGIANHSFMVRLRIEKEEVPSWFMAQLSFQRQTLAAGSVSGEAVTSDWTAPHWMQLLPDAWHLFAEDLLSEAPGSDQLAPTELRIEPPLAQQKFVTLKQNLLRHKTRRRPVLEGTTSPPGKNSSGRQPAFLYWAVLTRQIEDAAGAVAEQYLATLEVVEDEPGAQFWYIRDPIGLDLHAEAKKGSLRGFLRLLQIQASDREETLAQLAQLRKETHSVWELFFPRTRKQTSRNLQLPDCAARITLVSPALSFLARART